VSRVNTPLHRDPVEIEARRMSPARRGKIITRDKHCRYPGCGISDGLEVDHIVALALGGRDSDDNLECLCGPHHAQKTRRDIGLIAKAKRLHLAHTGQKPPPTQKIKSRGFQRRWGDIAHD
jgi:5-methylcytosine-specific restriction endonuclease McrA